MRTGQWVGDCFVYTNSTNRLNYLVGDQTYTISHFDSPHYVLGYLLRDGRVYVADKDVNVISFALSTSVIEYQTLVLRGDLDAANAMLPDIAEDQKTKIARFLEGQGYKEEALSIATDPEHRFDLSLALGHLDIALDLARKANTEHQWKTVGDAALTSFNIALAEECFLHANDLGSLLLLYTSSCNEAGLRDLISRAEEKGARNIAFSALWSLGDVGRCIDVLIESGRTSEAVLLSQTYMPSRTAQVVESWKAGLTKAGKGRLSRALGVPPSSSSNTKIDDEGVDTDLFPRWNEWMELEKSHGMTKNGNGDGVVSSVVEKVKEMSILSHDEASDAVQVESSTVDDVPTTSEDTSAVVVDDDGNTGGSSTPAAAGKGKKGNKGKKESQS